MTLAGTRSTPINATVVETRLYSWNMDTDPRPVRHCLCAENKADSGTVDLWNSADLCDYQRCTDPVRGSVCTVSHRHRLDGCFFPRGDRLFAPMGLFGVRVVRQPHFRLLGRLSGFTAFRYSSKIAAHRSISSSVGFSDDRSLHH